jgi:hypothetical protein
MSAAFGPARDEQLGLLGEFNDLGEVNDLQYLVWGVLGVIILTEF